MFEKKKKTPKEAILIEASNGHLSKASKMWTAQQKRNNDGKQNTRRAYLQRKFLVLVSWVHQPERK